MPIASLPMYDVPELAAATDALWRAVAAALRARGFDDVPAALCRDRPHREPWLDPALLLSQTCGYPLVNQLAGRVRLVATPRYRVAACQGAWYRSAVMVPVVSPVTSLAELRGATCAANEPDSHSGMSALRALVAPLAEAGRFFAAVRWTGAHRRSLEALAAGEVDAAAIDCVTFALLERARPDLAAAVRPIALTAPCPGPPLITRGAASDDEVAGLRAALDQVAADRALASARDALLLDGFEVLPDAAYGRVTELEAEAVRLGYPVLG
jgi:ABC-type phosphate/phosphonate transport system substrate-binding protein